MSYNLILPGTNVYGFTSYNTILEIFINKRLNMLILPGNSVYGYIAYVQIDWQICYAQVLYVKNEFFAW